MANEFEIKNCPFCNSESLGVRADMDGNYSVHCFECETQGPVADRAKEAVEKWNKWKSGDSVKHLKEDPLSRFPGGMFGEQRWVTIEKRPKFYSDLLNAIKSIAKTLEEICEQKKLIAAKILKEEKEGLD